ncbi:MAG: GSCFA domain-containing protein [Prevotellaceae bacterium]|jgi:hypothetical protein|nr:GSCFA domain-containing protein [Prevotellaceae bacterium]
MQLSTPVNIDSTLIINHKSRFLLLGSCFAENIGQRLKIFQFDGEVNPFGILFNPLSISTALKRLIEGSEFSENELFEHKSLWHSDLHHGKFSDKSKIETLIKINASFCAAKEILPKTDFLIITFGSAQAFLKNGKIVANCHKLPENLFVRKMLTISEIVENYCLIFNEFLKINPTAKIILSVSPVRYLHNGIHKNSLSKATLLLAVEELTKIFPQIIYFPAYEILLDELRDYRFFADDMLHPSALAEQIVWERFAEAFFDEKTKNYLPKIDKLNKMLAHCPLHENSDEYRVFMQKVENLKMEIL